MDDLLNTIELSGLGARIGGVFCGAPMYTDDLALVAGSPEELQAMLDIVSHYASQWHYQLNSSKSVILVLGESPRSRALARSTCNGFYQANNYKKLTSITTLVSYTQFTTPPWLALPSSVPLAGVPSLP